MWMPDGKSLYFMSDRSGAQNLWTLSLGGKMRQVTKFTDGRVIGLRSAMTESSGIRARLQDLAARHQKR